MRLLGAILASLKNGLLLALECAWGLICLPLRMLAPPQGRSAIPSPPAQRLPREMQDIFGADRDGAQAVLEATRSGNSADVSRKLEAAKILGWAARTAGGQQPDFPSGLPIRTAAWARNLKASEIGVLARAGFVNVCGHIQGQNRIDGVPTIAELTTSSPRPETPLASAIRVPIRRRPSAAARPAAAGPDFDTAPPAPRYALPAR
jgi:hypothetical protein